MQDIIKLTVTVKIDHNGLRQGYIKRLVDECIKPRYPIISGFGPNGSYEAGITSVEIEKKDEGNGLTRE